MKIKRLVAKDVHGYLPISIDFNEDLTFLTGLNGCGKTTALRLLMGFLAPSVEELNEISFSTANLAISAGGIEIEVEASRTKDGLLLSISTEKGALVIPIPALQMMSEERQRGEAYSQILVQLSSNNVFQAIRKLSTPMFLGLDRRLHIEDWDVDPSSRYRKREFELRNRFPPTAEVSIRRVTDATLSDVNELVAGTLSEIRAKQERLDEELRNQILLESFQYDVTDPHPGLLPSRAALGRFRERQAAVEKAAAGLRLPVGELQSAVTQFFDRMARIVDAVEQESSKAPHPKAKGKSKTQATKQPSPEAQKYLIEWAFNSRQADRIFKQIDLLDSYVAKRAELHLPIDRFLALANGFLSQTSKSVKVSARGSLRVDIKDTEADQPLFALSSGERQLIVMLAHLSLNKRLAESGVFIVDEPELSLHIGWQEQFVDAIQQANPSMQLILATHSPAIIMDRVENCFSLS